MNRKTLCNLVAPVLSFVIFSACANTAGTVCTREDAMQAERESSTLRNWDAVYGAFVRFKQCDDGAIGEGYSDSVARLLERDWAEIDKLNQLASANTDFERFVLHHIDELMTPVQASAIHTNARTRCPASVERLCQKIIVRLHEVDQSLKSR